MGLFREMDEECLEAIVYLLNQWWNEEDTPEEMPKAKVVPIHKKETQDFSKTTDPFPYQTAYCIKYMQQLYNNG